MLNSAGHVMPPERGADHTAKAVPGTGGMQHSSAIVLYLLQRQGQNMLLLAALLTSKANRSFDL